MSTIRRHGKPALVVFAVAILAAILSACAWFKAGSLSLTQISGIGPVRVHFELCTVPEQACDKNPTEGQSQYMLGIAFPAGSTAPQTLRAESLSGGAAISYVRNEEVTQAIDEASRNEEGVPWPPPGSDAAGYLSGVFNEEPGPLREWAVNLSLPLPGGAAPFTGPFTVVVVAGWRRVDGTHSADRIANCYEPSAGMGEDPTAGCVRGEEKSIGTADLRIRARRPVTTILVGGRAQVPFDFDFASMAATQPTFSFSASGTLPGATLTPATDGFATGPLPADTHLVRSTGAVTVQIPDDARPGTYDVSLTGMASGGAATSGVAKVQVVKAALGFGRPKLNRKKGTALLPVTVPDGGTLALAGRGVRTLQRHPSAAGTLTIPIRPRGKAKGRLTKTGRAKVSAQLTYRPLPGVPVTEGKTVVLRKTAGR